MLHYHPMSCDEDRSTGEKQQLVKLAVNKDGCLITLNFLCEQRRMVEELLREDGLTIMAAGLAWQRVAGVLVQIQMERRRYLPQFLLRACLPGLPTS